MDGMLVTVTNKSIREANKPPLKGYIRIGHMGNEVELMSGMNTRLYIKLNL